MRCSPDFEEDTGPVDYNHVELKHVRALKVRYTNVGRLLPRCIPLEDEQRDDAVSESNTGLGERASG